MCALAKQEITECLICATPERGTISLQTAVSEEDTIAPESKTCNPQPPYI